MERKTLRLTPRDIKEMTDFMVRAYRGELIPLEGRPSHFEEADQECTDGPFVRPLAGFVPDVERDFGK